MENCEMFECNFAGKYIYMFIYFKGKWNFTPFFSPNIALRSKGYATLTTSQLGSLVLAFDWVCWCVSLLTNGVLGFKEVCCWLLYWRVAKSWWRGWSCVGSPRDWPPLAFARTCSVRLLDRGRATRWCSCPHWAPTFSSWSGWVVCWCSFPSD